MTSTANVTASLTTASGTSIGSDTNAGIENLEGSPFFDDLNVFHADPTVINVATGGATVDFIKGIRGGDTANGGDGRDKVFVVNLTATADLDLGTGLGHVGPTLFRTLSIEDASIEGTGTATLVGTDDPNNLSSNGPGLVSGLGGDDLLVAAQGEVRPGLGNDEIHGAIKISYSDHPSGIDADMTFIDQDGIPAGRFQSVDPAHGTDLAYDLVFRMIGTRYDDTVISTTQGVELFEGDDKLFVAGPGPIYAAATARTSSRASS